jgi:hypothetical protein
VQQRMGDGRYFSLHFLLPVQQQSQLKWLYILTTPPPIFSDNSEDVVLGTKINSSKSLRSHFIEKDKTYSRAALETSVLLCYFFFLCFCILRQGLTVAQVFRTLLSPLPPRFKYWNYRCIQHARMKTLLILF